MHQQESDLEGRGCYFRASRGFPLKSRTVSQTHYHTYLLFLLFTVYLDGLLRKCETNVYRIRNLCNAKVVEAGGQCWWVAAAELST